MFKTRNKEFKRILELLEREGFIINSFSDSEAVLQKESLQINLHDLTK